VKIQEIQIPYEPSPKQMEFHASPARFRLFLGGIGAGKTFAGANEALGQALLQPGSLGVVISPTFTMVFDIAWRTFMQFCPEELRAYRNLTRLEVRLVNGSTILFRSADKPDKLRGLTAAWAWLDEGALMKEEVFLIIQGRLRQQGYDHKLWVTSTPKGKNWLYKVWCEQHANDPDYALIRARTADNPHLSPEYLESLKASFTGRFAQQELEAQFVGFDNLVYPEFDASIHVWPRPVELSRFREVVGGIDFGYTNPTAMLAVGVDGDGRLWVLDEIYERRLNSEQIVARAKLLRQKWQIERFFCDPSGAEHIATLQAQGIPAYPGNNAVLPGIQQVAALLAVQGDGLPRLLVVGDNCPHLLKEFEQYSWSEKGDQPLKCNDHAMDALRYVAMEMAKPKGWVLI